MSQRFIKYIPGPEADWLRSNYPFAMILLQVIAERARRENGLPDGLTIGQAQIGDWENYGMTRQNYRTALDILELRKYIKIIETNRTRKKSTTGSTTKGTLVELTSSTIYDINSDDGNHSSNHRVTTAQPLGNHEQEGIRKNKKEKEVKKENIKEKKIAIREWVELSQSEIDKLFHEHGDKLANAMLDILDGYNTSRQRHYTSDYGALKKGNWVHEKAVKATQPPIPFNSQKGQKDGKIGRTPGADEHFQSRTTISG